MSGNASKCEEKEYKDKSWFPHRNPFPSCPIKDRIAKYIPAGVHEFYYVWIGPNVLGEMQSKAQRPGRAHEPPEMLERRVLHAMSAPQGLKP
jgi:hypothetical protein